MQRTAANSSDPGLQLTWDGDHTIPAWCTVASMFTVLDFCLGASLRNAGAYSVFTHTQLQRVQAN